MQSFQVPAAVHILILLLGSIALVRTGSVVKPQVRRAQSNSTLFLELRPPKGGSSCGELVAEIFFDRIVVSTPCADAQQQWDLELREDVWSEDSRLEQLPQKRGLLLLLRKRLQHRWDRPLMEEASFALPRDWRREDTSLPEEDEIELPRAQNIKGFKSRSELEQGLQKVEEVLQVDNADNYLRYAAKRQKIRKDLENKALSGTEILPPASSAPASGKSPHIKTHEISLKGLVFHPEEPIDFDLQESWLWHGTRKEGVEGITSSDFDIKRAGSAAGTMFGCGLYFAESCMKSDEYTVADERGWYPLILCRVTCGRFFYCDWKRPFDHTDQLEDACHHKGFHCVLGDREKVSGTYREYIVFDNDQVYPEYIVWYSK